MCDRELVIAKWFDEGNKGYLTNEEWEKAILAVKNKYQDNFKWGLEQTGTLGSYWVV